MGTNDVPSQVRVRTEGSNRYRYDAIMKASKRFDCNKTRAIVLACDVAGDLVDNIEEALQHENLPPGLAAELADTISTRLLTVEYEPPSVTVCEES